MMKKILFIALIITTALISCKKSTVTISGKLDNPEVNGYLYLSEIMENSIDNIDSLQISDDGNYSFEIEADIPKLYVLKTSVENYLMFIAEPGEKLNITASWNNLSEPVSVTGSEGTEKMLEYNKALRGTVAKLQSLTEIYNQNSGNEDIEKVINTLDSTAQNYIKELNSYTKNYIDENLNSLASLVALYQRVSMQVPVLDPVEDIKYYVKVDSSLFSLYPESGPVKALHGQVQELVSTVNMQTGANALLEPGSFAPEISLPSVKGDIISLTSTRGKIVLLDFWAAWCGPCRRENPNLVAAYKKYSSKGFEIYQVSIDKTREDWVKGIEDDGLGNWIHVSDLQYWNSPVLKLYNIQAIPFNLLLDREGKIIASNLRGASLEEKLKEVFN